MRSTVAVLAGFVVVAVLSLVTDQVLHVLNVYPPWGEPMWNPWLNLLALTYRTIYTVAGGYLTATLAPRDPMRHVIILGCIGTVFGVLGAVTAISMADLGPSSVPDPARRYGVPRDLVRRMGQGSGIGEQGSGSGGGRACGGGQRFTADGTLDYGLMTRRWMLAVRLDAAAWRCEPGIRADARHRGLAEDAEVLRRRRVGRRVHRVAGGTHAHGGRDSCRSCDGQPHVPVLRVEDGL